MEILPQLLVNSLITGSIYALSCIGIALTYGVLRVLNFAHGQILMLGAYSFYLGMVILEQGMFVSAMLSILITLIVACFALKFFITPFMEYSFFLPFVSTLALATIIESIVAMTFGVNVKSLNVATEYASLQFGSIYITPIQILIIVTTIVVFVICGFTVHCTSFGRQMRAMSEHAQAAQSLSVSRNVVFYGVFCVSMLLTTLAGILVGYETNLQPTMGNVYTIKAFAGIVLGGMGNVWGAVAGSYILGLIENLSIGLSFWEYSLPAGYKDAFAYVIILIVLLFKPHGLFKSSTRKS